MKVTIRRQIRRSIAIPLLVLATLTIDSVPADAQDNDPVPILTGKTALVTGSTSGLGREVAIRLGGLGAHVLVHGRNEARAREVVDEINQGPGSAEYYLADFASLDDVRDLVTRIESEHSRLHLLINNAAIFFNNANEPPLSEDGYESTFQVNYLAHYLITEQLLPVIRDSAPSRIINVSARGQIAIDFDDVMMEDQYSAADAYMQSKLAQVIYTFHLAKKLDGTGVTVNVLHPASMMTNNPERLAEGARAVVNLAVSPELTGRTGLYFVGMQEARPHDQAYNERARQQLDALSRKLVGMSQ